MVWSSDLENRIKSLVTPLELPISDIPLLKRSEIVDADMIQDTERFKMDLAGGASSESSHAV